MNLQDASQWALAPDRSCVLAPSAKRLPCLHAVQLEHGRAAQACTRAAGSEIEALFLEYEAGETAEARLVKDFDKARCSLPRTTPLHYHPLSVPCLTGSCLDLVALSGSASHTPETFEPALHAVDAGGTGAEGRSVCGSLQPTIARRAGRGSVIPRRVGAQVEMVLQAAEYEAAQGLRLQPFFASTAGRFQTPTGRAWAAEVARRRALPDAAAAVGAPAARGAAPGAEECRGCGGAGAAGSGSCLAAADGAPEGEGGPGRGAADAAAPCAAAAVGVGAGTRGSASGGAGGHAPMAASGGAGGHAPMAGSLQAGGGPLGGAQRAEARRRGEAGALAGGQARAQEPCQGGASAG